ncbi:DUF2188 domain-containing protein [Flavobacterium caseinilyticum]|uniref:DUF2188 domain-containing protein n=1 Tax=Flavobacterium caseinilyticum TaxID=2541732 RepID=A0A4R5APU0_9FLAO|nr:DUF2188 domain-containing protein [Flavobacterium caseinilyticum]TDD74871.1 DUF2188 domain-containing protein [Flavobacterium caseinilyticum]
MAKGKNQHVVPKGDDWAVRGAGNEKATKIVSTQKEAIKIARDIAINQGSEMFIHGENGQIRERNTYGKDNFPPKG